MLKSMTAYGRASNSTKAGHFVIEIQSVNRKFLDVNVILPLELSQFDSEIKKWLQPHLARGQVTVKVSLAFENLIPILVKPNLPLARQIKKAWEEIAYDLNVNEAFHLSLLQETENLILYEENLEGEEVYRQGLKETLEQAMQGFLQMKAQEGAVLQNDISKRLEKIVLIMQTIQKKAPFAVEKYRAKLLQRLEEIIPGFVENDERILKEIALFAEKIDITEETTRFSYHIDHFKEVLNSTAMSVGKTMEFILQELNREINTIGNKSLDIDIARSVIEIKSELEKIREQTQNIE